MRRGRIGPPRHIMPRGFLQKYVGVTKAKDGSVEAIIPESYIDAMLRDLGFIRERRRQRFREKPAKECRKMRNGTCAAPAEPPDAPLPFEDKKEPKP